MSGIVVLLALVGLGFLWYPSRKVEAPSDINSVIVYEPPTRQVSGDSREYKNLIFHFSLEYPKDLEVKEYNDGTSASTITLEDATGEEGFQIFVVPYDKDYITKEQFKKDAPSGVMQEPVDIVIDGVPAKMFFGKDAVIGDTREVWFIRGGFLYEITAAKKLDAWLSNIMQTWRFLPN